MRRIIDKRLIALALLTISLTACGTRYPSSVAVHERSTSNTQPLPASLVRLLKDGMDYQRSRVQHPDWDIPLELELQPAYYAASGRYCRTFLLYPENSPPVTRLACRQNPEQWVEVRPITQIQEHPEHQGGLQ